jgi:cytochrome c553
MAPVKRLTPDIGFPESQGGSQVYGTPYPLSEKYFLAVADFSMTPTSGAQWHPSARGDYGIYLVDAFGNKELIYRDTEIGCNSPIPILPRPTPPAPPQQISIEIEPQPYLEPMREKHHSLQKGTISIVNVYQSLRQLPEKTKLKELRVLQLVPMSVPSGSPPHEIGFREPTSTDSVVLARYVLGTVPIEEDGSVHFEVPPRRELMLQVLDEDGLAVQSMRSSLYLHDGEMISCNGCHEPKTSAPLRTATVPKAFQRSPSQLKPDHPDSNPFSYPRLVQPVLDKNCVACHADEIAKGTAKVPNLAKEPIKNHWYASFNELVPKYGFYSYGEPLRTTPGKFGARASKLYEILTKEHYGVKLSAEELHRITLWLDCVSIFYGVYEKEGGEAQLRGDVVYPTLE